MSWAVVVVEYEGCGSHECTVDAAYGPFGTEEEALQFQIDNLNRGIWGLTGEIVGMALAVSGDGGRVTGADPAVCDRWEKR